MQSDEDKLDKVVKFLTPNKKSQDKVACFSLRQAPSGETSEINKMSSKQTSLFRVDIKSSSDDVSQNGTSVQSSWRLNPEGFIDSIIAAAKRKSEMKFPNYSRRREWRTLHQRTKEIVNVLIRISEHLERIEMNKTTVEDTGYLNCASHLTKIIPGMLESLTDHFVPEKENFCESPPNPTSETSRARSCNSSKKSKNKKKKVQQQAQDIFTGSTTQHIVAPEVAPNLPGLTPRTDQIRSQGAQAQAKHQFMEQKFLCPYPPPPMRHNLPHLQTAQNAQGFTKRLHLPINFGGIPKLKIPIFDGELSEYQKFKLTFNTEYDNGRNLPEQHLVSLLEMSLQGKPLKLVSDLMQMGINDQTYACMWQLLDDRFGDRNTEDKFTVGLFKDTLPIKNGSLAEVERIYEIFLIQHAYYLTKDPPSLTMETSLLFQYGKRKLNDELFIKFVCFAEKYKLIPNFTALITFMQAEILFAQKEE
jgi:hypothetical protein